MTYEIKIEGKGFKKTIKNVKAHLFPADSPKNLLLIILENEERIFINFDNCNTVSFSRGWFEMEKKTAEIESQGQAKIN